jgi:signal transduction histidine kinase
MAFAMAASGRAFGSDDLDLAVELGRRTAAAIDNAIIYRQSIALRMEAEAASNAKSDFLAKMSHEIRTPINAMMGYAELLQMGISGPVTEMQTKQLARIRASGDHLTSLIDEILDLAKIEAGRMAVHAAIGRAADPVDAALALIRPLASAKGVEIEATVESDSRASYVGDPQRVQQILANLLSNAVKFTESGGRVSVSCGSGMRPGSPSSDPARWTWIEVADTGVGIAEDDLDRIFQPFIQVDGGYTRSHGGTGLGLTISRTLAQMMGGDITVTSAPGRGSRFTLWLSAPNS